MIHPTPQILGESLARTLIWDTTDNLILMSLLNHATAEPNFEKSFLSENGKDFDSKPYPKDAIERAGIK